MLFIYDWENILKTPGTTFQLSFFNITLKSD